MIRNFLPVFTKPIFRFLYYKNERRKVYSNFRVRKEQDKRIKQLSKESKKLIVFIVPGADWFTGKDNITGGILSIASIYEETKKLKNIHGSEVIMCTLPGEFLLMRHTMFPNNIDVFRFDQIKKHFTSPEKMLIHIPEYIVQTFQTSWEKSKHFFKNVNIHVNILNQRIDIMPTPKQIQKLAHDVDLVTQTTAHEQYTTPENHKKFGIPMHKLSVFGSPERYERVPVESKKNIITFSPDPYPQKEELIQLLKDKLPAFTIREVRNLTYTEYLTWVADTKFTITLGEGLDFYFIETVFSGGVAFALDKDDFFTDDFKEVPGIYENMNRILENIRKDMEMLAEPEKYMDWNKKQYTACSKLYKYDEYVENLRSFYRGEYTYA